jgi:hypothetical protein
MQLDTDEETFQTQFKQEIDDLMQEKDNKLQVYTVILQKFQI